MGTSAHLSKRNECLMLTLQARVQHKFGQNTYSHRDKFGQTLMLDCSINHNCTIMKSQYGIEVIHEQWKQTTSQQAQMLKCSIDFSVRPGSIVICSEEFRQSISPLFSRLWLIVDSKTEVKTGDIYKLSQHILKVVDIVVDRIPSSNVPCDFLESLSSRVIDLPLDASCRICYESENTQLNPILKPCRCQGSISFIHLECLRKWIIHSCGYSSTSSGLRVKKSALKCSVCQDTYSTGLLKSQSALKSIFLQDAVRTPYIKLEVMSDSHSDDNFVIVESLIDSYVVVGRSSQCQIKMGLDHLSRKHCKFTYDNTTKKVFIQDLGSSFATLKFINQWAKSIISVANLKHCPDFKILKESTQNTQKRALFTNSKMSSLKVRNFLDTVQEQKLNITKTETQMISKEQYRSILLEQIRENEQKKILQKNERRSMFIPEDRLFILGQHKKLHQHQQPVQQELIYANLQSKPVSSASSRRSVQNHRMRLSKQIEISNSKSIVGISKDQQEEKTLKKQYGVVDRQLQKKAFSPRSPARSKVFTEGTVGPQVKSIYQQGARNLLKLENLDMNQVENQHRKRLQMQRQLKEQIEQIELRKREERQRRVEEQRKEMERDKKYQEEIEKRRMEQSKKKEEKILRQSEMGQQIQPTKLQPTVHKDISTTEEKKRAEKTRQGKAQVVKFPILNSYRQSRRKDKKDSNRRVSSHQQQIRSHKNDPTVTEALSSCQSDLYSNTSRSSSTAKKQEYRKMQMMIAQVRRDIKMQQIMFKRQIDKARREATQAIADKLKLEKEFKKLVKQVSSMGNSLESLDQYYEFDKKKFKSPENVSSAPESVRRRKFHSKKQSTVVPLRPDNQPMMSRHYLTDEPKDELGLNSLMAESKKIPIILTNGNEKVTMSRIQEYAVESRLRPKKSKSGKSSRKIKDPKQDSMNEFLENPYGMNLEKSNRRSFESVDFNLSSVDSSVTMEVGNLVQKESKVAMCSQIQ